MMGPDMRLHLMALFVLTFLTAANSPTIAQEAARPTQRQLFEVKESSPSARMKDFFHGLLSLTGGDPDPDTAIVYFEKALKSDLGTFGEGHPKVANDWRYLGLAWAVKGNYTSAIDYFERALKADFAAWGAGHLLVVTDWILLGTAWAEQGNHGKAIGYYERVLKADLATVGESDAAVARDWVRLGIAWREIGHHAKAIGYLEKALKVDLAVFGKGHPRVARDWIYMGTAWADTGDYDKAIGYFEQALSVDSALYGEEDPRVAFDRNNLGAAWQRKGASNKASRYFAALDVDLTSTNRVALEWMSLMSLATFGSGQGAKLIGDYERIMKVPLSTIGEELPDIPRDCANLGLAWANKGDYEKATGYLEKAVAMYERRLGPDHPYSRQARKDLEHAHAHAARR